ncbi:ion transporter [Candidatus Peribacteria bacterium]|nr:MAG: ion transporter [Candidatus Peribacteria bacterium]
MDMPRSERRAKNRRDLWAVLHDGRGRSGQILHFVMVVLILVSVAILPIKFLPGYATFNTVIDGMEAFIVAVFTVEYFLRIYAAPNRIRYLFSFYGIVDALSIAPFYTGIFQTEYIRILRFIRFFKLGEMQAGAAADRDEVTEKNVGLVEGESVEFVVSKHPLFLFLHCIPPAVAISFSLAIFLLADGNPIGLGIGFTLVLFALLFLLKGWLDFNYDVIYLTNFRLIFHNQHLFGRSINQVNYFSITNVKPSFSSMFSFLFRYGTLDIDTAADTPGQIHITMVRKHEKAAHIIMHKSFEMQNGQRSTPSVGNQSSGSTAAPSL